MLRGLTAKLRIISVKSLIVKCEKQTCTCVFKTTVATEVFFLFSISLIYFLSLYFVMVHGDALLIIDFSLPYLKSYCQSLIYSSMKTKHEIGF